MFNQRLVSQVMLWSLAAAAVFGVVGVLFAQLDVVGRVAGTALLTSIAAALLWQAAVRLEPSRPATMVAQIGVLLFYLFALGAIWDLGDTPKFWFSAIVCLGTLTVVASGWFYRSYPDYRYTGLLVAIGAAASGLCWLFGIWMSGALDRTNQLPFIGTALAGWSATAAICLTGVGTDQVRPWRWAGVLAAVIGLVLSIHAIHHGFTEPVTDWLFLLGSIVLVVIHALLCFAVRSAPPRIPFRIVAVVATIATAVFCDLMVMLKIDHDSLLLRLATAAGIVASASTIATAFIIQRHARQARLAKSDKPSTSDSRAVGGKAHGSVQLICPNCITQIEVPTGHSNCPNCKLAFRLDIGS